jgi:hypothetical protein
MLVVSVDESDFDAMILTTTTMACSIASIGTIEKPVFATIDAGLHIKSHGRKRQVLW